MRKLTSFEKDELLRFFLHYMSQEQRNLLMAHYPMHYKMLYPTVSKESLAFKTAERIEWMEANSTDPISPRNPVL